MSDTGDLAAVFVDFIVFLGSRERYSGDIATFLNTHPDARELVDAIQVARRPPDGRNYIRRGET